MPLEDREDPTEGSEEATELQMDTCEGEKQGRLPFTRDIGAGKILVASKPGPSPGAMFPHLPPLQTKIH